MASDAIDTAVMSRLSGDSTLSALLTGGVHFYEWLTEGSTEPVTYPFALVVLLAGSEFRDRAWEVCHYLITVHGGDDEELTVPLSTLRQAYARIDELLEAGTFSISGYTLVKSRRERRYVGKYVFDKIVFPDDMVPLGPVGGLYAIWAQAN